MDDALLGRHVLRSRAGTSCSEIALTEAEERKRSDARVPMREGPSHETLSRVRQTHTHTPHCTHEKSSPNESHDASVACSNSTEARGPPQVTPARDARVVAVLPAAAAWDSTTSTLSNIIRARCYVVAARPNASQDRNSCWCDPRLPPPPSVLVLGPHAILPKCAS